MVNWLLCKKIRDGGKGSGNFGHKGRPGQVGGSAKVGGSAELFKAKTNLALADIDDHLSKTGIRKGDVVKVFGLRKDVLLTHAQNCMKAREEGKFWRGVFKDEASVREARNLHALYESGKIEKDARYTKLNRALARYDFVTGLVNSEEEPKAEASKSPEKSKQVEGSKKGERKPFKTVNASEMQDPSPFNILDVGFGEFVKYKGGETRDINGRKMSLRYGNNFCKVYMESGMGDKNADNTMHSVNDMMQDAFTKIKSMYKESGKNPFLTICIGNIGREQGSYDMQENVLKINTFGQRQIKDTDQMRDTILHELIHMTDNGEYRNNKKNNFNMVNLRSEWFAVAHCLALTGKSEFLGQGDPMRATENLAAYWVSAELSNYLIKNYGKEILMDVWNDKSEPSLLHRIMKLKDRYKIKENNWRELLHNACQTKDKTGLERRLLRLGFISNADITQRGGTK